jgi:molybdopterin synthase catalytic subunit
VRLFAILRERAGRDALTLELAEGATVADALEALAGEPGLGELLARLPLGVAVNREYAGMDATLGAGDELALIPPVSGGADAAPAVGGADVHVRIADGPLSIDALARAVGRPGAGATVVFAGTTRTVQRLDYETYREMAQTQIETILQECAQRHELQAAVAEHRVGSVPLGEASVVVAVSSAHRPEAFAGAREAIDRIKAEAPIWKREVRAGETGRWVQGTPAPGAK